MYRPTLKKLKRIEVFALPVDMIRGKGIPAQAFQAHRVEPYAPIAFTPKEIYLLLISVKG